MSRTVCSWCKAPLVLKDDILVCGNTDCPACDEKYLHEELIRTRKALDVAVDALNAGKTLADIAGFKMLVAGLEKALEQITALKQKESALVHNKIEFPEFNDNLLEEFDKQFFENGQDDDLTETALEQKD